VNFVRKARCYYRSSGEVQRAVRPGTAKKLSENGTRWFALLGEETYETENVSAGHYVGDRGWMGAGRAACGASR